MNYHEDGIADGRKRLPEEFYSKPPVQEALTCKKEKHILPG